MKKKLESNIIVLVKYQLTTTTNIDMNQLERERKKRKREKINRSYINIFHKTQKIYIFQDLYLPALITLYPKKNDFLTIASQNNKTDSIFLLYFRFILR